MKNEVIVILSGEIGAGKTSLSAILEKEYNFKIFKTSDALKQLSKDFKKQSHEDDRMFLQRIGEQLDKRTDGRWVVQYFQKEIRETERVLIDSARIQKQVDIFRESFGHQKVIHVYLDTSETSLELRYFKRYNLSIDDLHEIAKYKSYKANPTEHKVKELIKEADLVVDTDKISANDNALRVASFLRLLPQVYNELVDVIIGGQFGSEGKGQISAYMSRNYDCLVRVGGPNAGHKVFATPDPLTFKILPSGATRAPHTKIILGPGTVISLPVLLDEIKKFDINPERLIIDELATIIAKGDVAIEKRLDKIGSTKQGVGGATANNLLKNRLQEDLRYKAKNCPQLLRYIGSARLEYEKLYSGKKKILLEGTQGTMLSLHHGIYPYVTSRDTTVAGCLSDAGISPRRIRKIVMVTRTYPIRVESPSGGTSGPFSRMADKMELSFKEISERSGIPLDDIQKIEKTTTTHRTRRIAEFNWVIFREACELNSPTDIALTFTDYIDVSNRKARRYDQLTKQTTKFIDEIERCSGVPVSLIATHFNHRSVIDRRNWI